MIWLSEGKDKFGIENKTKQTNKQKKAFHHKFVVSLLLLVLELVRRRCCCSVLSFDNDGTGCSITMDGNCWKNGFGIDSFVGFTNGRSSSGPRKFKLNLRILNNNKKTSCWKIFF